MNHITKIRVVDIDHTKGTLSAVGKYKGKEQSMEFQFSGTHRKVEVNYFRGDETNVSLSVDIFSRDTYPHVGDEICLLDNEGQVLGWFYYLEYELALFRNKRQHPIRITGWMKTLGITPTDKLTERLIKEKFRYLSKELHPDKPNGDDVKFCKLVAARDEALRSVSR